MNRKIEYGGSLHVLINMQKECIEGNVPSGRKLNEQNIPYCGLINEISAREIVESGVECGGCGYMCIDHSVNPKKDNKMGFNQIAHPLCVYGSNTD